MKTNLLNYDLQGLTRHFADMGEKTIPRQTGYALDAPIRRAKF